VSQEFRDFLNAAVTVERAAVDAGLVHHHRAAFVRFTLDLDSSHVPDVWGDYTCECGEPVRVVPDCMFCGQAQHHLCWNYLAAIPGACACPCFWERRAKHEVM